MKVITLLLILVTLPLSLVFSQKQGDIWVTVSGKDTIYHMTPERAKIIAHDMVNYDICRDSLEFMVIKDQLTSKRIMNLTEIIGNHERIKESLESDLKLSKNLINSQEALINEQAKLYKKMKRQKFWASFGSGLGSLVIGFTAGVLVK